MLTAPGTAAYHPISLLLLPLLLLETPLSASTSDWGDLCRDRPSAALGYLSGGKARSQSQNF
jgi:hypothetical protein